MNFKNIIIGCLVLSFASFNTNASLITHETRSLNTSIASNGLNSSNFKASWDALTSSIKSTNITNFKLIKTKKHTFNHLRIDLSLVTNKDWSFDFAVDSSYGAAVYLDDSLVHYRTDDLWWGYNWNSKGVFKSKFSGLTSSNRYIDLYWAEKCCGGKSSIRFKDGTGKWLDLTVANLTAASIPEPTSLALMGLGLLGLTLRQRLRITKKQS